MPRTSSDRGSRLLARVAFRALGHHLVGGKAEVRDVRAGRQNALNQARSIPANRMYVPNLFGRTLTNAARSRFQRRRFPRSSTTYPNHEVLRAKAQSST